MRIFSQDIDHTIRKNLDFEKELESLSIDSISNVTRIVEMTQGIRLDSVAVQSLDEKLLLLERKRSKESINRQLVVNDSLKSLLASAQNRLKEKQSNLNRLNDSISQAKQDVRRMGIYSQVIADKQYQAHQQYLLQRFSVMSNRTLREMADSADNYADMPDYQEYKEQINRMQSYKKLYDSGTNTLDTIYNFSTIDNLRNELYPVLEANNKNGNGNLTEKQYMELDSLDIKLSRYKGGLTALRNLIKKINKDPKIVQLRKANFDSAACIEAIESYIYPQAGSEDDRIAQRYFSIIPYLSRLLETYWNEIQKSPFEVPTETETKIFEFVIEK